MKIFRSMIWDLSDPQGNESKEHHKLLQDHLYRKSLWVVASQTKKYVDFLHHHSELHILMSFFFLQLCIEWGLVFFSFM